MTDKPVVVSKSRVWSTYLNFLFYAYENLKFLVVVRDLRNIVCSFEKLLHKYPVWVTGDRTVPFHMEPIDKRLEIYCTDIGGNLGRPLKFLPHVVEWAKYVDARAVS